MSSEPGVRKLEWPVPPGVHALVTTRNGGSSAAPYDRQNLAFHVGDDARVVSANRARLQAHCGVEHWQWLRQVHGTQVVQASPAAVSPEADGVFTSQVGVACAVLTADCLPILICDSAGHQVAAVHAGWRGLCDGVVHTAVNCFKADPEWLLAYLAPAISQVHYEVDQPVREAFLRPSRSVFSYSSMQWEQLAACFQPVAEKPGHYLADLYALARVQLASMGCTSVYGGDACTFGDADHYYSYRRDGVTGRFASVIWLAQ